MAAAYTRKKKGKSKKGDPKMSDKKFKEFMHKKKGSRAGMD